MLPFTRQDRESLCHYLLECLTPEAGRWPGEVCDHTLRHTANWLSNHGFDAEAYIAQFHAENIDCDCRALIYTVRTWEDPPS
jgi:hypothetical protein